MEILKFFKRMINVEEEEEEEEENVKKKQLQSNVFLPNELVAEIITLLSVKNIVRLKCVSKSWNILISDPTFVQRHHKYSSQNPHLILKPHNWQDPLIRMEFFPVHCLLENPSSTVPCLLEHGSSTVYPEYDNAPLRKSELIGTYKGLLCLFFSHGCRHSFCLWNPATRTKSGEFGTFRYKVLSWAYFMFSFGCDISTGTYKVVAYRAEQDGENEGSRRSQVQIFSLRDNSWRNIESFSSIPIRCNGINGVHLSGTVNWLTLTNYSYSFYFYKDISYVEQFVIVSLDLSTETYTRFLLPSGFHEVPQFPPTLHVLMDCLCFSHDFKRTEFVIWQMKEFGVHESWTQLFRIDYINLQIDILPVIAKIYNCDTPLLPLYISKNGDTLILAKCKYHIYCKAIIYNQRNNKVEKIRTSNKLSWFYSMDYVESLVSTPSILMDIFWRTVGGYSSETEEDIIGGYIRTLIRMNELSDSDSEDGG